jgi:pimeloyl-ACP methyl ester carboxylesterase
MKPMIKAMMGALLALVGCGRQRPFVNEARLDKGWVLVFPGIEGKGIHNRIIRNGLARGGVPGAVEIYDWTFARWLSFFYNLRAESRNRRKAADIARQIEAYQQQRPGRPVFLVGQSGGGAMTAFVAEALSGDHQVEGIVMLAGALSPDYRLDAALARSRRGIVNSYSHLDLVFLAAGTTIFGTSDGQHSSAAGRVGFRVPEDLGEDQAYRRLYQVAWRRDMIRRWNLGGHQTSGAGTFVENFVAPLLLADHWDEEVVARLSGSDANPESSPSQEAEGR